ncbi:tRNA (guanosine(46)-N7)-methyltransferase TrmB [Ahrensia sp. R2A130]|uniref:tRNA (guanosine(46)-N7)-methyltransferase TrmB n=1 Tax=Ahrensia sp. R2A130 TaxID=744979 RepID=UPI0001E0F88C|nr:tRNA (guanosine(46)-N7)-methyltransferase TrmB [Ahrensia sp. R2A130]EFL89217.1 tRNA (guanine-N(7)-)-methyltransferase [Ahrensia sp. R2A130]
MTGGGEDTTEEPRRSRSTESFYGRRKGPPLHGRKAQFMDDMLPKLALDLNEPAPANLADLFPDKNDAGPTAFKMEIGFGGGEHLAGQAKGEPDTGFIGIEPFINGMAKMLGKITDDDLTNVRLHDDDAVQVLDWLPEASLDRVDLLYPDPWPKVRHWKRRFVGQANLERIHRVLKPGGYFRFASDIDTYINWTLQHVNRHGKFQWQAETAADWNEPWEGWTRTRYEAKAIREGRPPCYLVFAKAQD